jgi:hypothetical protein
MTRINKKLLSIILVLAMTVALLTSTALTASAVTQSGYWTDTGNYDIGWYGSGGQMTYAIADEDDLAGLAAIVNGVASVTQDSFAGATITLNGSIDLSAHYWYPIGGVCPIDSSGFPQGLSFKGNFDGGNGQIDGLYMQYITAVQNDGAYGLFGFIDNGGDFTIGNISNVTVGKGSVNFGSANQVNSVGAIIGYTNGNVYNCHNIATPVTTQNSGSSMLGGIAGTVENLAKAGTLTVNQCSNTADLTGRGRVGGIVGAVYSGIEGNVIVNRSFNKDNTLTTVGSTRRSFLGGITGFCSGYITNCYSYNATIVTQGGHYQAGISGVIQGESYGTRGALSNSYAYSTFASGALAGYDAWLYSDVDFSDTDVIANSLWVDTSQIGTSVNVGQPVGTGSAQWGYWTNTGYFYDGTSGYASLTTANTYSAPNPAPPPWTPGVDVIRGVLNATSPLNVPVGYFANTNTSINNGYPYLDWE